MGRRSPDIASVDWDSFPSGDPNIRFRWQDVQGPTGPERGTPPSPGVERTRATGVELGTKVTPISVYKSVGLGRNLCESVRMIFFQHNTFFLVCAGSEAALSEVHSAVASGQHVVFLFDTVDRPGRQGVECFLPSAVSELSGN